MKRRAAVRAGWASALRSWRQAENSEIWDIEGNRYIDFGGGIAVVNTGHRHPLVMKRVQAQLEKFTHTCATVMPYEPFIELCEKLNQMAPISGEKKSALVTTGAEAVENAIKFARAYTGRSDVIAFHGGFHGRTNLAMALTGKVVPYKAKFGPFAAGVWLLPSRSRRHGRNRCRRRYVQGGCEPTRVAAIVNRW
jgi:4-aminobutyrate aminotransferase/(S)-3-amino-2-methylpropionate transaminase